jgi:hypothetical protein
VTHTDPRVRGAAIAVLPQFRDTRVRALAFDPGYRADAADVLTHNYEPGDEATLLAWIQQETDADTLPWAAWVHSGSSSMARSPIPSAPSARGILTTRLACW